MATRRNRAEPEAVTVYLIEMKDGTKRKITLPSKYKLTFGPLVPGSKGDYNGNPGLSLRVYDGTNQKAVFTGVQSFRDTSIPVMEEVTQSKQETFYKDEDGERKAYVMEASVKEWINPDAPRSSNASFDGAPKLGRIIEDVENIRS